MNSIFRTTKRKGVWNYQFGGSARTPSFEREIKKLRKTGNVTVTKTWIPCTGTWYSVYLKRK